MGASPHPHLCLLLYPFSCLLAKPRSAPPGRDAWTHAALWQPAPFFPLLPVKSIAPPACNWQCCERSCYLALFDLSHHAAAIYALALPLLAAHTCSSNTHFLASHLSFLPA